MGILGWILGGAFLLIFVGAPLFSELMSAAFGALGANWPF